MKSLKYGENCQIWHMKWANAVESTVNESYIWKPSKKLSGKKLIFFGYPISCVWVCQAGLKIQVWGKQCSHVSFLSVVQSGGLCIQDFV